MNEAKCVHGPGAARRFGREARAWFAFAASCTLALALAFPLPASAGLISATRLKTATGTAFGALIVADVYFNIAVVPGSTQVVPIPFPIPAVTVTEASDGTTTATAEVAVQKTAPSGESSAVEIDFDALLLPEEAATFKISLEGADGLLLGPNYERTVDVSSAGSVTFDLTDLLIDDVVLRFALTLLDSGADTQSAFDVSRVQTRGVTLAAVTVPEPTTAALLLIALLGFAFTRGDASWSGSRA